MKNNDDLSNEKKVFDIQYKKYSSIIDSQLKKIIDAEKNKNNEQRGLYDSIKYSTMAPGKRLRPVLGLAINQMLGGDINTVLPYLCALELIHTYSLIHDDLPIMDDDDYRRGIPTNHKVYGEAVAVLAGDALLNMAYELMISDVINSPEAEKVKKLEAINYIANASGAKGMIGGQYIDITSENSSISSDLLFLMHSLKTGALIKAAVMVPVIMSEINAEQTEQMNKYAENIGIAFQIKDDILDKEGNSIKMGKKIGGDKSKNKSTYVSIYGIDDSKKILKKTIKNAISALDNFGDKSDFLKEFARMIENRDK